MNPTVPTADASELTKSALEKETLLRAKMHEMQSVLVAYSGGVDSSYLAFVANQELGSKAYCVLGSSPSVSKFQIQRAGDVAGRFGLCFTTIETSELENPSYAANPANRCYYCKSELYALLRLFADQHAISNIIDGTNADDVLDVRPGRIAAAEHNVRSPLAEVSMSKAEIRAMSKYHSLPTWDEPASPCLSSRIAYGIPVTIERLGRIENAEEVLRSRGFREFRVRLHGELARIEIAREEMERFLAADMADEIGAALKEFGFRYVTLDLQGFRSGSLNGAADEDRKEQTRGRIGDRI